MSIGGTESYIYYTSKILGSGISGIVYFGRHKRKGDACAVKIFHMDNMTGTRAMIQQNEFQFMRRLQHENVIKLLAIERDSRSKVELLIMEYCSEGSLQNRLKSPEFLHGYKNEEYIDFCNQFSRGLQYLWEHGITHRDIKPGNILCSKNENGRIIYKITDFGSSKEFDGGANSKGMYGTEEYLHPKVFQQIILRKTAVSEALEMAAEMWAVGVTLYQVACGRLPFVVPNGRNNKELMFNLLNKKKSGQISGCQISNSEEFEYSTELYSACLLSKSIQTRLVQVLSCLLESSQEKQFKYETFFPAIREISDSIKLYAFQPLANKIELILLPKNLTHAETMGLITDQLKPCRYSHSDCFVRSDDILKLARKSSQLNPVIFMQDNKNDVVFTDKFEDNFNFPTYPKLSRQQNFKADQDWVKACNAYTRRIIHYIHDTRNIKLLFFRTVQLNRDKFHAYLDDIKNYIEHHKLMLSAICGRFENGDDAVKEAFENKKIDAKKCVLGLNDNLDKVDPIYNKLVEDLEKEDFAIFADFNADEKQLLEVEMYLQINEGLMKGFFKDSARILTYNDQQIHKLQRGTLETNLKKALNLLKDVIWPEVVKMRNVFADIYWSRYNPIYLEITKIIAIFHEFTTKSEFIINKILVSSGKDISTDLPKSSDSITIFNEPIPSDNYAYIYAQISEQNEKLEAIIQKLNDTNKDIIYISSKFP